MIRVVAFYGVDLELDDELFYYPPFDYWIKVNRNEGIVSFGLTPAAHVREGGYRSLEYLVQEGEMVGPGEPLAFAVTAKIKYLDTVAGGVVINLNHALEQSTVSCQTAVGGSCLLASIRTDGGGKILPDIIDFNQYVEMLRWHEKNFAPPGTKGAVSPTCRSVYYSIRKQKE